MGWVQQATHGQCSLDRQQQAYGWHPRIISKDHQQLDSVHGRQRTSHSDVRSGVPEVGFVHGLAAAIYQVDLLWNSNSFPNNISPSMLYEQDPLSSKKQNAPYLHLRHLSTGLSSSTNWSNMCWIALWALCSLLILILSSHQTLQVVGEEGGEQKWKKNTRRGG